MLTCAASAALSESEMTEEQINEASKEAYDEALLQGETQIAFTTVATLGQYLSDLMVYIYGEIPASETDSANVAVQLVEEVIRRADLCFRSEGAGRSSCAGCQIYTVKEITGGSQHVIPSQRSFHASDINTGRHSLDE